MLYRMVRISQRMLADSFFRTNGNVNWFFRHCYKNYRYLCATYI